MAANYSLPPVTQRPSQWADFGEPPQTQGASEPAKLVPICQELFDKWQHPQRRTCSLAEIQHAVLGEGGKLRSEWARRLLARAACWCRARGRPGRLARDDFVTLLVRVLLLIPEQDLGLYLSRLGAFAAEARIFEQAAPQVGMAEGEGYVSALLARTLRKWDKGSEGVIDLPVLRLAMIATAEARSQRREGGVAGLGWYSEWLDRAPRWRLPVEDGEPTDLATETRQVERCCGEAATYAISYWRRHISFRLARRFITSVLQELFPDVDPRPEALEMLTEVLHELDAHYSRLVRQQTRSWFGGGPSRPRPASAPAGGSRARRAKGRLSQDVESRMTHLQCGACGHCMLRIDRRGEMVDLTDPAHGETRPLTCPACGAEHLSWRPVTTAFAVGRLVEDKSFEVRAAAVDVEEREHSRQKCVIFSRDGEKEPPRVKKNITTTAVSAREELRAKAAVVPPVMVECKRCGRKMLSMTSDGTALQMLAGVGGGPVALRCPGCEQEHQDWEPALAFDDSTGIHCAMRTAPLPTRVHDRIQREFEELDVEGQGLTHKQLCRLWIKLTPRTPITEAARLATETFEASSRGWTGRVRFGDLVAFVQSTVALSGGGGPWMRMSRDPATDELRPDSDPKAVEARKQAAKQRADAAAQKREEERRRRMSMERAAVMLRCKACGRHTLNADNTGRPFQLPSGAFGKPPPLTCAGCGGEEWEPVSAFSERGQVEMARLEAHTPVPPWQLRRHSERGVAATPPPQMTRQERAQAARAKALTPAPPRLPYPSGGGPLRP